MIKPDQHIVLVGMTGVGKSTVARVLGVRLGRSVWDSDQVIEGRTGRSVRDIFAADGEPEFRRLESEALADAPAYPTPLVIATGGGIVVAEANRAAMRAAGARVVWLCADPATLIERVKLGGHRPLLDADPAGTLQLMFKAREPLYREVADAIVLVDNRSVSEVVEAVLR